MIIAPLLALLCASPPQLDAHVASLYGQLTRRSGPPAESVAVVVELAGDPEAARVVEGLLVAHLMADGARVVPAAEAGAPAERALAAGAEWLLHVRGGEPPGGAWFLTAELLEVDRGLWAAASPPRILAVASITEDAAPAPKAALARAALRLEGPPARLMGLEDTPLALAACEGGASFALLTREQLHVLTYEGARVRERCRVALAPLARATVPVRAPVGAAHCRVEGQDLRVAFGTTDLAEGHVVVARKTSCELAGTLPGLPLVAAGPGEWWTARAESGTPLLGPSLTLAGGKRREAATLPSPVYALTGGLTRDGWHAVGLDAEYRLARYDRALAVEAPLGKSGVAYASLEALAPDLRVETSASPGPDHLRLSSDPGRLVPLPGQILAVAAGRFVDATRWHVLAATDGERALWLVPIGGAP